MGEQFKSESEEPNIDIDKKLAEKLDPKRIEGAEEFLIKELEQKLQHMREEYKKKFGHYPTEK
ncbi:MAG: hypothetical protein AAB352_03165 [Patescibacteria group bacterium]